MITHVAIRATDGKLYILPSPNRHHNILWTYGPQLTGPERVAFRDGEQGFMIDGEEFVSRKPAKLYALKTGQYLSLPQYEARHGVPRAYTGSDLFSEDLW